MQLGSSTRATFRFEPLRDNSRTVGGSEVIRLGIVRVSPGRVDLQEAIHSWTQTRFSVPTRLSSS
jgi:hypothetical protein